MTWYYFTKHAHRYGGTVGVSYDDGRFGSVLELKSHILTGLCLWQPLFFHLFHMSTLGNELFFMYRHSNTADGKWDDSHDTVTFTVHSVFASFGQERRRWTYGRVTRRNKPSHMWCRSKRNGRTLKSPRLLVILTRVSLYTTFTKRTNCHSELVVLPFDEENEQDMAVFAH